MSPKNNFDQFDHFDELEEIEGLRPKVRNRPKARLRPRLKDKYGIIDEPETVAAINAQADDRRALDFTYQASQTEASWLLNSLGGMFENQWFDDVLNIVKGGKEASVYQCKGNDNTGAEFLAAKVYRPRMFRSLRNDAQYREGRAVLDDDGLALRKERELKAIRKRTEFGSQLIHQSWIMHEVRAMQALHAAGLDVPAIYANGDNAILMDYIGDADMAAPLLHDIRLDESEARTLFDRTLYNIEAMLAHGIVHGDLSAFNILYWEGEIRLIDFPQIVDPEGNRSAFEIFQRDVLRVCEYFERQGIRSDPARIAHDFWRKRGMQTVPEADPRLLDPEDDQDLDYWENYGGAD